VTLVRDKSKIVEYKDDPVVLWFWRSRTNDTKVDSFLQNISISRNFHLSGVLRWEAKNTHDLNEKFNKLKLASHFDSVSIENFLSFLSLALSARKLNLVKPALSLPILNDFRNQIFILGNFLILLLITLFFTTVVFIIAKFLYYFPFLSHRFDPMRHTQFKGIIGFALLLIPILVLRNLYLVLIIYGILLTLIFNNREKNWLRVNLLLLIILSIFILSFNFASFLKGTDKTYLLYQTITTDSDIRINPETSFEKEVVAYALKRQGLYDEALGIYEDLYYNNHVQNVAVLNNLANLYTAYDEDERAEELYRKATMSDRGEPYFNLALLKLKKIEYLPAGEYMEEARKRGCVYASREPLDIPPSTRDFYGLLKNKGFNDEGVINKIFIIILLIIFILTFLPFRLPAPYFCHICGKPVCRECAEGLGEEFYCKDCLGKLSATKNAEIEEELRESLGKNNKLSKKIFSIIYNLVLPGAGLIYRNKNFMGLVITFFASIFYVLIFFKSLFIKPAGWICLPLNPILICFGGLLLLLSYLISFIIILFGGSNAD
jgi:hypothetical protein